MLGRARVSPSSRWVRGLSQAVTCGTPVPGLSAEACEQKYLLGSYNGDGVRVRRGLVLDRGLGCTLYDTANGRSYLDWFAGIAVNALGHSDPGVAAVLAAQAGKVQHLSNLYHSWEPLRLAELMVRHSRHFQKVFLCNSGTEANEGALKLAKKHHLLAAMRAVTGQASPPPFKAFGCKASPPTACLTQNGMCGCWPQAANNDLALHQKTEVLAFKNSFHGRSMGSLAVTHKPAIRYPFGPFPADVRFARFNNIDGQCPAASARSARTHSPRCARTLTHTTPPPTSPPPSSQTCTRCGPPRLAPSLWSQCRARAASTLPLLPS